MSNVDWNRWNAKAAAVAKDWPEENFDWSNRAIVPKDFGPHAGKKALMVLLSPIFTGAAMFTAVAFAEPEAAKDMIKSVLMIEDAKAEAAPPYLKP